MEAWNYNFMVPKYFLLTSRNTAKHSPDHMMQFLPYHYLCRDCTTSAKCLVFITVSYLNTPQVFICFHYKNTVLQHRWVCGKNCSPPLILLGTIQMDSIYIYVTTLAIHSFGFFIKFILWC